jgi:hypothetical protein
MSTIVHSMEVGGQKWVKVVHVVMEVFIDGERTLFHFFISETKRDFH